MRNKIYVFMVIIIGIFLAVDYFPDASFAEETNTLQKSEDVTVISNPKTPIMKMRIVFKEELSIGEAEGDENYMFGQSIGFSTDEDGNFYVSDTDANRIQKYDPDGKYLLTIGREGQGPGEFGSLSLVRFDNDNNIYAIDGSNNRISFFNKEGKYIK
jgi:DNA-binding beta-propeller fold protein YncE